MLESTLSTVLTDLWLIVKIVASLAALAICVRVLVGAMCVDRRRDNDKE